MIITTTPSIEGHPVKEYKGLVFGEVVAGINFARDFTAGIRNLIGGRVTGYEEELIGARETALAELNERAIAMGANAVVGVRYDYEALGEGGSMLMVTVSGTAVVTE